MKQIIRQPLVHFLAIGALMFVVDAWLDPNSGSGRQVIDVSASRIEALASSWEAQRMRPPSRDELKALVDGYLREEIFSREAKKLGLDRDDPVVRRRLAQKMEFLFGDFQVIADPDAGTLSQYYKAHAERYREPVRLSFRQYYFSPDRQGEAAVASAHSALVSLRSGQRRPAADFGDTSLLEHAYSGLSRSEIRNRFGDDFAQTLTALPVGQWQGPILSAYGLHLVLIEARTDERQPDLEEVRDRVLSDYTRENEQDAQQALYRRLRGNYTVHIENSDLLRSRGEEGGG